MSDLQKSSEDGTPLTIKSGNLSCACPCGYKGNNSNIRLHRMDCPTWLARLRTNTHNKKSEAPK